MKIRNGFVSNSSSSSFLMLGVKMKECTNYSELYAKDNQVRCHDVEEGEIVGYDLARWDDDNYLSHEISQLKIEKALEKLNNLGFKNTDINMYCGTTSS